MAAVVSLSGFAWTATSSAEASSTGCPTGWEERATPNQRPGSRDAYLDLNDDGLSCWLEAPEGGGVYTVTDNSVARP